MDHVNSSTINNSPYILVRIVSKLLSLSLSVNEQGQGQFRVTRVAQSLDPAIFLNKNLTKKQQNLTNCRASRTAGIIASSPFMAQEKYIVKQFCCSYQQTLKWKLMIGGILSHPIPCTFAFICIRMPS